MASCEGISVRADSPLCVLPAVLLGTQAFPSVAALPEPPPCDYGPKCK